ncbi:MAG: hypothetical protein IBX63_09330 [Coriobacteriia bacterium]|nr:hypothetical protein [Coriobacteriia bacterium]
MSGEPNTSGGKAAELEHIYAEKALAEFAAADRVAPGSDGVKWSGDLFAEVVLVKGEPGPAEVSGGAALSGPDGVAARKALETLGFDQDSVFATVAHPEAGIDPDLLRERLVIQVEAVDPTVVVALDATATAEVAAAFSLGALPYGTGVRAGGRTFVAVDGLEASLADERAKRRVWRQMQAIEVRPPAL